MSDREARIDETARALFVMWCSRVDGTPPPSTRRFIAESAYSVAIALEDARPIPDASTSRPLAVGDRVRGLGGWSGTRGQIVNVCDGGARVVVKAEGALGSIIHSPPDTWEREEEQR